MNNELVLVYDGMMWFCLVSIVMFSINLIKWNCKFLSLGCSRGERREIEHNFVPIKTWLASADTGLSNLPGGVMMALLVHSIRKTFSVTWFKCMIVSSPNNCLILFDWYLENVPPELKLAFLMSTSSIRAVWRQFTTRGAHTGFDRKVMRNFNIHSSVFFLFIKSKSG